MCRFRKKTEFWFEYIDFEIPVGFAGEMSIWKLAPVKKS